MQVNYSDQEVSKNPKSIFLAGPSPRSSNIESWRKSAIKILENLGFDGVVYVPEKEFDNGTYDYYNQVWWEREALYNASTIVFWIPRSKEMPAFTTNVEFGYWMAKNPDKSIYGRPDDSEKNRYLDWLYTIESNRLPINNLEYLLKKAIVMANKNANAKAKDYDSYELNKIKNIIQKYPEITSLVGKVEFTPESYGINGDSPTYGRILFNDADSNDLKEFDRTILSVLLYYYIKDGRYDKFVEQQLGSNKLTRKTFDKIREFITSNFDTHEKENLLLYYVVINDLGKSNKMVDFIKEKGIETVDHDLVLNYLLQYDMLPSIKSFSQDSKDALLDVLNNEINFGQFIQGEIVDYSFDKIKNLSDFERVLMVTEAMLDIGGAHGHINNHNGSIVLNESTINNFMTALEIVATNGNYSQIYDKFLNRKAEQIGIKAQDPKLRKAITRISLMMRLIDNDDVRIVENELSNNLDKYDVLVRELNESGYGDESAILLYYSPALLNNTHTYFKKNNSKLPIEDTLRVILPFMQNVMIDTRENINKDGNGVITVMLRDAAITASENPYDLSNLKLEVLGKEEAIVKKIKNIKK